MTDYTHLPYRPCAGIMLVNAQRKVFVGQRLDSPDSDAWQMPQGGIDDGETPREAALRELQEETGITPGLAEIVAQSREEYRYDLPGTLMGKIWGGKWRGQRQSWFLMRFLGVDSDVDITTQHKEFSHWKWAEMAELPELIVPFKKKIYQDIIAEFSEFV